MAVVTTTEPPAAPRSVWFGPFVPANLEREFMAFLGTHNGVAVLSWPRDRVHAEHLAQAGLPRLLLVPPTELPPPVEPLQDWLPARASHTEIHSCLLALARAAEEHRAGAGTPTYDEHGWLRVGDTSVAIPDIERPLAHMLVTRFEQPVTVADLTDATVSASQQSLRALLGQLGRLVNTLGLEIAPVPGDACILRRCADRGTPPTRAPRPNNVALRIVDRDRDPEPVRTQAPRRKRGLRHALPMHFRSGLLAPEI